MTTPKKFSSFKNDKELVLFKAAATPQEAIERAQKIMLEMPQADAPVTHIFGNGLYIRETRMSPGAAVGHYQRYPHMCVLVKGKCTMIQSDGTFKEFSAPMTFIAPPGKKAGYVLEDCIWLNIYATNETDVEKLENYYLDKDYSAEFNLVNTSILDSILDETEFKRQYSPLGTYRDLIELPYGSYKMMLYTTPTGHKGLFATASIVAGETICPAKIGNRLTIAGRYVNNSEVPNAEMRLSPNGDVELVAIKKINGNCGGVPAQEITVNYVSDRKEICHSL
jgi:hypothetical protein